MAAPVMIRNASDTYVTNVGANATKNFGSVTRMYLGVNNTYLGMLSFGNPIPPKAKVKSAKLHLWNGEAWAGAITLSAQLLNAAFNVNKTNWNNRPSITGAVASQAKTNAAANTEWILDITALMQSVSNGTKWYGFRIFASGATKKSIFSTQAGATVRPMIEIEWSEDPFPPTNLIPRSNNVISTQTPKLQFGFVDVAGNRDLASFQVQISTNNTFTAIVHDSGTFAATVPEYDLAATAFVAAPGTVYYWRVLVTDGGGFSSGWSLVEAFQYVAMGVPTCTNPTGGPPAFVEEPTPPITWTTPFAQTAYQLILVDTTNPGVILWDTGRVTSTDQSISVPSGLITVAGRTYRIIIRAWDNLIRMLVPGFPPYGELSVDFVFQLSAATTPVASIDATPDAGLPSWTIEVVRATMPDSFSLKRDGVVVKADIDPATIQVAGNPTHYVLKEFPSGRQDHTWEMLSIVNGKASLGSPTVTKSVKRTYSWLCAVDGSLPVALANHVFDPEDGELAGVMQPLDGPPFLVTQALYGESGGGGGRLTDGSVAGLSARQMKSNLRNIRKLFNGHCYLMFDDEMMEAYIFGLKFTRLSYPDGSTDYDCSFDFIQVGTR